MRVQSSNLRQKIGVNTNLLDTKTQQVIDCCMKSIAETSAILPEAESFVNADEINDQEDIELNERGVAYISDKNLMKLIELLREHPCIWNSTLRLEQRNQYVVNMAWAQISAKFPGWNPQTARKQFVSLKSTFLRRNIASRSGSAGKNKKPWIFEPSFNFIKDIMLPGTTISNISPPQPKRHRMENEDDSSLRDLGFHALEETSVPNREEKTYGSRGRIILKNIANKVSRESRPPLNQ